MTRKQSHTSGTLSETDCRAILGVAVGASREDIVAARRRLARSLHPDKGGTHVEMARVNEACRVLLSVCASHRDASGRSPRNEDTERVRDPRQSSGQGVRTARLGFRDAPSFVIQALPVEAFELLLVAAATLGEVVDEDPPYLLEVLVRDPGPLWCRFELFPDAGSTTVALSCDVEVGFRVYSAEEIRDLWIGTINGTMMP